jgi:ergothioneine biosynthesis protein EgtB
MFPLENPSLWQTYPSKKAEEDTQTMPAQTASRAATALLTRFRNVRAATCSFTAPLSAEDMMVQSCAEASPVKWHLAHTSWFFETFVLTPYLPGYKPFHPEFHWLFNSYYNALGEMPAKGLRSSFSRPGLDQILAYRTFVDAAIEHLLASDPGPAEDDILRTITLGLEHEQQHLELIATDIKHALYTNPLHPAYFAGPVAEPAATGTVPPAEFQTFPGGLSKVGITPDPADPLAFAFDNETPRHTVYLQPFAIASRLVTCAEYLAFLDDNGYSRPELWLSEGWNTMRAAAWQAPLYWQRDSAAASGWSVYTLRGTLPLDALLNTPVCHLSFFEADAFARWKGCRLPTEFEWEHAAASLSTFLQGQDLVSFREDRSSPASLSFRSAAEEPAVQIATSANMLESGQLHPRHARPVSPLQQIFGDVWEWTASPYTGYPGYKPLPGALGEYNGKFMSSQVILRGGSCVTPASHIRPTYRNFFGPSTRWQFSGLRLAQDA